MAIQILKPDGTALGALAFTLQRGVPAVHIPIRIQNTGALTVSGLQMFMYAETVPSSGNYFSSGHPAVDEVMGRLQITGINSVATAGQVFTPGIAQPMGHLQAAILPDLLAGDWLLADVWLEQAGVSAGGGAVNIKFEIGNDSRARAVPDGLSVVARGIDPGLNQAKSFFINGRLLTATPGDALVHAAAGGWLLGGVEYADAAVENLTLTQSDGASVALAAGQEYYAAISQGIASVPNITKGLLALAGAAVLPNVPTGELLLGFVRVSYHAGASVIGAVDVTQTTLTYGRFLGIAPGSGLSITIYAGEAIAANYHQFHAAAEVIALAPSVTNRVWLLPSGVIVATATAVQPAPGALLLYTATTDGTHVTALVDNRLYIGAAGALVAHAATHATAGTDPVSPASIGAADVATMALKAPLADPPLTGVPTAPTAAPGTNTTQLATTAFVRAAIIAIASDHEYLFPGDGINQPAVLSPVPAAGSIPHVFKNGLKQQEGTGLDYTRSGANLEQVTFTIVPITGDKVEIDWRG